jgi:hypothetical protein
MKPARATWQEFDRGGVSWLEWTLWLQPDGEGGGTRMLYLGHDQKFCDAVLGVDIHDFMGEAMALAGYPDEVEAANLEACLGQLIVQKLEELGHDEAGLLAAGPWELAPSSSPQESG